MTDLMRQKQHLPAKQEARLKHVVPEDFKSFLLKQVFKLYFKNGQNAPSSGEAQMFVNELYDHLQKTWPGVKQEWIRSAFDKGIAGDYGEFANISFNILVLWIKKFRSMMNREDFGIKEDPMASKEKADFILSGLKNMPNTKKLFKKNK